MYFLSKSLLLQDVGGLHMSPNELDVSHLFDYPEDTHFACAAYQELLGRPMEPEELCYAVQMLKNGLSRKGFIYWISRSQEFNHRIPIKNLQSYMLPCYLYKGFERVLRLLHLNGNKSMHPQISSPVPTCCPTGYICPHHNMPISFETEFNALSTGQISQISGALPADMPQTQWHTVGYLASELLEPHQIETSCLPDSFSLSRDRNNLLMTSPEIIYQLFVENQLGALAHHINDTFIFTMPKLPSTSNNLSIIWDCNWTDTRTIESAPLSRWLKATTNSANLSIINETSSYRKVSISFNLVSYDLGASVIMKCSSSETLLTLSNTICPVSFDIWLNPGYNCFSFTYMGPDHSDCNMASSVKFAISDLKIPGMTSSELYDLDETKMGSNYYPYLLPESYIRTALHQNGFFEVRAFAVSSTYSVQKLAVTRYDYLNDELGKDCYYTFENTNSNKNTDEFSSLIVYLARRTSKFYSESFIMPNS